ncbi:MAG TPA: MGMT family protein [Candidatus Paceibacterota bacterium]|nr:MGMT family protein [Candidatus Paceibacterota bacterium]
MKSPFTTTVRAVVASIPKGKVATYGQVAALAGHPGAARAVGMVMRTNKDTKAVPCHRVVGSTGALTGYAYGDGVKSKKLMLEREGVTFKGDKIDLSTSGWKPMA